MQRDVDPAHDARARLAEGVFAVFGAIWFGGSFGAMAAAIIGLLFSGSQWMEAVQRLGAISVAFSGPFLVLGYPQPFVLHSRWSAGSAVLALLAGFVITVRLSPFL